MRLRRRASLAVGVGRDLLFAILACGLLVLVALGAQLQMTERDLRDRSLEAAARYVERNLRIDANGAAQLPSSPGSSWASFGYPALVFDRAGRVLFERPSGLDPTVVERLAGERLGAAEQWPGHGSIRFFRLSLGEQQIIGAALSVGSPGNERVIEVFKDENAPDVLVDDIVRDFPWRSSQVLLPVFALLLLTAACIVWNRVRPITEVSAIAATIGADTLYLRLPVQNLPREVLPIVRAVNGALERLEEAAASHREFQQRAVHHLRTPLAVLAARADALENSEAAGLLRQDVREISRTVSQLLDLNDLEGLPDQSEALADLAAVGQAVRDDLAALAARQEVAIALHRPDVPVLVRGDPNLIELALRNLIENGLQHSPPHSTVNVTVGADGSIEVADAGPGIDGELQQKIFEPFWSGDPQGSRPGLGLTIVRRVAERYDASLRVGTAPGGGALFALRFAPFPADAGLLDPAIVKRSIPATLAYQQGNAAFDRTAVKC